MKEVVMGVADTATFAFKLVVDPVKTTTEMKQQAQYLIDHPEVLVEAAKMAYHQFDEGTPEEKARMLGSVAAILVPGFQVTKAGKVGKVLGEVEDVVSQAAKDALQGIKQRLPNLGPVVQTPEGFVFKIGEIPDTPALPKTPVQQRYMDGLEGGTGKVKLTEPSLPAGGKPKGNYGEGDSHGIKKQNDTDNFLADSGYDIKMLDEIEGGNGHGIKEGSNPDFLIEGKVFDCYAPKPEGQVKTLINEIAKKTKEQSARIVLNLDNFPNEKVTEIINTLLRKANPNGDLKRLEELILVKDGKIIRVFGG
ncbi:CdiA C-terminal domain-containing protein [Paenibacillus sp. FSL H7-0756]|uniref:CdiA C-terminal domain-containing protein n=1 Tax=Paenibacillus sp. FSL H7-0756 TaxID=2954738 RepID=UPI0030F600AA